MPDIQPATTSRSSSTASAEPQKKSQATTPVSAYRLSRVQAEGWNAAHRISATTLDGFEAKKIERLNPYTSDPERARWRTGFENALKA